MVDFFLIALAKVASTLSSVPCMHIWNEKEIVAAAVIMMIARRPFSDAKNDSFWLFEVWGHINMHTFVQLKKIPFERILKRSSWQLHPSFSAGLKTNYRYMVWRKNCSGGVLQDSAKLRTWFRYSGENRTKVVLTFLNITKFSTNPNDQLWQEWKRKWHEKC